jgi:hypothetical protein
MDQHLTLQEARTFTRKSESTLKRLLREIVSNPNHVDRLSVLPAIEEVERRKAAKEPYVWKIDRQLLLRRFPANEPTQAVDGGSPRTSEVSAPSDLMLQVLQDQLKSKDQQIRTLEVQLDRKDEQISSLGERMMESNVLMRELQQRLTLPSPRVSVSDPIVESRPPTARPVPKHPAKPVSKPASKPVKQKRGFFGRLFRGSK